MNQIPDYSTEQTHPSDVFSDEVSLALQLQFPHSSRLREGQSQQNLGSMLESTQAALQEAATISQEAYDRQLVVAAEEIGHMVHVALKFSRGTTNARGNNVPPSFDELEQGRSGLVDCYGHTYVASLCLDSLNIPHHIVHVAGHAAVVVPTSNGAHFINPTNPHLSQSLHGFTRYDAFTIVDEQIAAQGKAATLFFAAGFGARDEKFDPARIEYSWLEYSGDDDRLIMSIYGSAKGQLMLKQHLLYKQALAKGDLDEAANQILLLGNLYPELDARRAQEITDIRSIVHHLCRHGRFEDARDVIDARFSATRLSQDARFAVAEAHCRELLAREIVAWLRANIGNDTLDQSKGRRVATYRNLGQHAYDAALSRLDMAQRHFAAANVNTRPSDAFIASLASRRRRVTRLMGQMAQSL